MRRQSKVLLAIAVVCSFFTIAAGSASADYAFKGTFAGPRGEGAPCPEPAPGALCAPGRAAVEQSSGNLFVVDSGNDRVQVFAPNDSGTADYLTEFGGGELSAPWGIAIDENAGQTSVYVADAGNEEIVKYDSDEAATPSFTVDPDFASPAKGTGAGEVEDFHAALAIDPTTHELLVADNANKRIARFEADGTPDGSFDGSAGAGSPGAFAGPIDIAVNSTGDVYVIDATGHIAENDGTSKALRYSAAGDYKSTLPAVGTHERVATVTVNRFDDSVVVSGDQDNVYEAGPPPFQPLLGVFDENDNPLPSPTLDEAAKYDTVSGLAFRGSDSADRLYAVLDKAYYGGDHTSYGTIEAQAFEQVHPAAPTIVGQFVSPGTTEATLRARIAPGNLATGYHFEYGRTNAYGSSTVEKTIPAGSVDVNVAADIVGLTPGANYHFRVVAINSLGSEPGSDQTFSTEEVPAACPNNELRIRQQSSFLPDCRAYEQVSPVDKGGLDINDGSAQGTTAEAARQGGGISYSIVGSLPGASARPVQERDLGVRDIGLQTWATVHVSPPAGNLSNSENNSATVFFNSRDLMYSVVGSTKALAPGAVTGQGNMYLRNNVTGSYQLIATAATNPTTPIDPGINAVTGGGNIVRGNPELSAVQLTTSVGIELVPGQDAIGIYKWDRETGHIEYASTYPNGQPLDVDMDYIHPISADGSTIFYSSYATEHGVFMHRTGEPAVALSVSQRDGDPQDIQRGRLLGITPNGAFAFFSSESRLTDDATSKSDFPDEASDLYRYEVATGELIDITTEDPNGGGVSSSDLDLGALIGVSPDGDRAYFYAEGVLAPGAKAGTNNLYEWNKGSGQTLIAADVGPRVALQRQMSDNGEYVAFRSDRPLTGYDNESPACAPPGSTEPTPCNELYVYNRAEGLHCASCRTDGGASTGDVRLGGSVANSALGDYQPTAVLNDGSVFFDTTSPLVRADSNGKQDVYRYRRGVIDLISSGRGSGQAIFADSSDDGGDVFFFTREQLVGQDQDEQVDVYDARVGGGIAGQYPPPTPPDCSGEACRSGVPAPAPPAAVASATLGGPGNRKVRRPHGGRCKKHHRPTRCGKKQKGKRHHSRHGRAANKGGH